MNCSGCLSGDPGYGVGNSGPSYLNYSPDISVEGWGGDKGATWWMLSQYEGITASGDTMLRAVRWTNG